MPVIGRRDIALNWEGAPALVIETTEITIRRFCDVDADFALAEGEDETLEGWQTGHRAYFERNGGWQSDMELVCERFRMIEDFDSSRSLEDGTIDVANETTKENQTGTGLGLAGVYGAVKQNNEFTDVHSQPGMGTTFNIYLPIQTGQILATPSVDPASPSQGEGETLLIVEDEKSILQVVKTILGALDYQVLATSSSFEALDLARQLSEDHVEIDLLITDVIMPEMNGLDLAKQLKSIQPNMKCLYMSGYTADVMASQAVSEEKFNFIQKPFSIHKLTQKVREVLE